MTGDRLDAEARLSLLQEASERAARGAGTALRALPVRQAMVLCAGLGVRFRPLTERLPKPAVPLFGAPLVRYSFALLKQAGVERAVINTHHLPELMRRVAEEEAARVGLSLAISHEPVLLGTGGALRSARHLLRDESLILLNGDSLLCADLSRLVALHRVSGAAATMGVAPMPPTEPGQLTFGAVEANAEGRVARISGHGPGGQSLRPWHFLGVHVIEPEVLDQIPEGAVDINHAVYPAMIREGRRIQAAPLAVGCWADLGSPARYLDACEELLTGRCDLTHLGPHAPLTPAESLELQAEPPDARSAIDSTARICRGARVLRSHIGAHCVVGEGASVIDSAVLPGTRIAPQEELTRTIALDDLRLKG